MSPVEKAPRRRGKTRPNGPERTEALIKAMQHWQGVEREAIDTCAELMERTDNALVRQELEKFKGKLYPYA